MNIVCLGGGPAGLYFGLLMKLRHPEHRITVLERNKPYDTFGWGVVFSDATMSKLQVADPVTASEILGSFNHWDDIAVHFKGETMRSGGHGFCGIGRKRLLNILQKRCEALGVELVFEAEVDANEDIGEMYKADLVIACDGINSKVRTRFESTYKPTLTNANAVLCGWAHASCLMPSRLPLKKPSTDGFKRTPINTTVTHPPSLWKHPSLFGRLPALKP